MDFDIMNVQIEPPKTDINDYSWSIYGVAGVGKTSMCQYLYADPAYWQFEQGQNTITAKKVPVDSWQTARKYLKTLQKAYKDGLPMPFKTAIMDTGDIAWKYCTIYVCSQNGWDDPSEGEWGQGWRAVADEWLMFMTSLENLGIKPVYIMHDKDKEFKPKNKEKYDKVIPNLPKGGLEVVVDKPDFVVYCDYETIKAEDGTISTVRRAYFRSNGEFEAKSRLLYMPEYIEFGDTPRETAERIKEAFAMACEKEFGEAPPIKKATSKSSGKSKPAKEPEPKPKDEEKPVEVVEEKPKAEPKAEAVTQTDSSPDVGIDELKETVSNLATSLYKAGKLSPVELTDLIQEHTGSTKITPVNDVEKLSSLLDALNKI